MSTTSPEDRGARPSVPGFGKIFRSIYDGTLAEHWQALFTFITLVVLCDHKGVVDLTPEAISRRTGIPLDIITVGLTVLEAPDGRSRRPNAEGRRIERLDTHRDWGWRIVNHEYYKRLSSEVAMREYDRHYSRERRQRIGEERGKSRRESDGVGARRNQSGKSGIQQTTDNTHTSSIASQPAPDPDVKAFLDYAFQTFQEQFSDPLHIEGGKDGKIVKTLLGTYSLERLKALWDRFLESDDPYIKQRRRSIVVFSGQINKLISAPNGKGAARECSRCYFEHEPPVGAGCQRLIT